MGRDQGPIEPIKGSDEVLLEVENLTTHFPVKGGFFAAQLRMFTLLRTCRSPSTKVRL